MFVNRESFRWKPDSAMPQVGSKQIDSLSKRLFATGEVTLTAEPVPATLVLVMVAAAYWCLRRGRTHSEYREVVRV
jgi:hypothetical protein